MIEEKPLFTLEFQNHHHYQQQQPDEDRSEQRVSEEQTLSFEVSTKALDSEEAMSKPDTDITGWSSSSSPTLSKKEEEQQILPTAEIQPETVEEIVASITKWEEEGSPSEQVMEPNWQLDTSASNPLSLDEEVTNKEEEETSSENGQHKEKWSTWRKRGRRNHGSSSGAKAEPLSSLFQDHQAAAAAAAAAAAEELSPPVTASMPISTEASLEGERGKQSNEEMTTSSVQPPPPSSLPSGAAVAAASLQAETPLSISPVAAFRTRESKKALYSSLHRASKVFEEVRYNNKSIINQSINQSTNQPTY
jgi:hypothetical protein